MIGILYNSETEYDNTLLTGGAEISGNSGWGVESVDCQPCHCSVPAGGATDTVSTVTTHVFHLQALNPTTIGRVHAFNTTSVKGLY